MSCWVVPTIAAELWGIPVQHVIERMNAGHIPSKTESGFTFVDVAPESPRFEAPRKPEPPPTYSVVTRPEAQALIGDDADDQTIDLANWREARQSAEKRRRPPIAA